MATKTKAKKLTKTIKTSKHVDDESKYVDDEGAWLDEAFTDKPGVEFILDGKVVLKLDHNETMHVLDAVKTIVNLANKIQL